MKPSRTTPNTAATQNEELEARRARAHMLAAREAEDFRKAFDTDPVYAIKWHGDSLLRRSFEARLTDDVISRLLTVEPAARVRALEQMRRTAFNSFLAEVTASGPGTINQMVSRLDFEALGAALRAHGLFDELASLLAERPE
jgi:hypothetical protein